MGLAFMGTGYRRYIGACRHIIGFRVSRTWWSLVGGADGKSYLQ